MIFCHLIPSVRHRIHKQINHSLRRGGYVIYQAYSPEQILYNIGVPRQSDMLISLQELQKDFINMKELHAWTGERNIQEGKFHNGVAYVTEFIYQNYNTSQTTNLPDVCSIILSNHACQLDHIDR